MTTEKKDRLENIFFDDEYKDYSDKKKSKQYRQEKIAKFGACGTIIIICVFMYMLQFISNDIESWLFVNFGQYGSTSPNFKIWQLFTSMWLHIGFFHLVVNMFVLWSFGRALQSIWGSRKFITLYIISGIGGSLLSMLFSMFYSYPISIGASGAICGLIGSMLVLQPNTKILLFFFIPIKIKPAAMWFGIISLILALTNYNFGIGNAAHLGGLVTGYLITQYWKQKGNLYSYFIL